MTTRSTQRSKNGESNEPSTSATTNTTGLSKPYSSINSDQDQDMPRTECGNIESGPAPEMAEIIQILRVIVTTQEKSFKILSSIQECLTWSDEQNLDNHSAITVQLDDLSKETKKSAEKIEFVTNKLANTQNFDFTSTAVTEEEICSIVNATVESKTKELSDFVLKEKKEKSLKEKCNRIKHSIGLQWTQSLNQRKKFYGNFVKNYRKANLYKDWMNSSPDFLPLKYKPKRIPGETASYTKAKIAEAKQRYKNDVEQMLEYSKIHQGRVAATDKTVSELIERSCQTEEEESTLKQIWKDETSEQELKVAQAWLKTERFLARKKHEDGLRNEITLTNIFWEETLSRRVKGRRPTQQSTMQYYHYPSPW